MAGLVSECETRFIRGRKRKSRHTYSVSSPHVSYIYIYNVITRDKWRVEWLCESRGTLEDEWNLNPCCFGIQAILQQCTAGRFGFFARLMPSLFGTYIRT